MTINGKIIKAQFWQYRGILVFALAIAVAAGIFAWQKQEQYNVSLSLTIGRYGTQSVQDYKYDSYYAMKATDEFGETVSGWFKTPEMAQTIFKKTNTRVGSATLDSLKRRFKAAKISPNLVEVRFSAVDEDEAKNLAQAAGNTVAEKTNVLNSSSWQGVSFLVMGSEPVIVKNGMGVGRSAIVGFLAGLIVGCAVLASRRYFSE